MNIQIKNFIFQFSVIAVFIGIIISCQYSSIYDKYKSVPVKGWHKDSVIVFNFSVSDTLQDYNMVLCIRNDVNYKFSNLWLFIEISGSDRTAVVDTFEIVLANPSGKWMGRGIAGIKSREVVYRRNVTFHAQGEYVVKIRHGMRQKNLKGIHDLGLRVENIP
jgi:gliding motility-associated lipoprotein GldH